jgi:hypothetical protein
MRTINEALGELFSAFHQIPISYYPIHRDLTGKITTAVLFSYLYREFCYHQTVKMFATDKKVMLGTGLTENELRSAKKDIKKCGLITVSREGKDGKTHYLLDVEKLQDSLNSRFVKFTKPDSLNSRNPLYRDNKKEKMSERQKPRRTQREVKEAFINLATSLAQAVAEVRKIKYTPSTVLGWARHIQILHSTNDIEIPRIKRAMRWYIENLPKHYGEEFFLQIYSGESFKRKFEKLENAMSREGTSVPGVELGSSPPPPKGKVICVRTVRATGNETPSWMQDGEGGE